MAQKQTDTESQEKQYAYLKQLTLEQVKCFKNEQTIDFSTNGEPNMMTVILGNNGTGKTTILKSLVYLEPVEVKNNNSEKSQNSIIVPASAYTSTLHIPPGKYTIKLNTKESEKGFLNVIITEIRSAILNGTPLNNMEVIPQYSYGASRKLGVGSISTYKSSSNLLDEEPLLNAEEWLLQSDYAVKNKAEGAQQRLERIKDILISILPDVQDFKFITTSEFENYVSVTTEYGEVPLRELSHGYLTMTAWIVDFSRRMFEKYPQSENPLAEPAIVLVDEIDLHLHPVWQRSILNLLRENFPKTQFIVTSHSPLIVQAATDANIVLLKKEENGVVIHNHMEVLPNARVDQILTSELFGLESARPPKTEKLLSKRAELLSKRQLSPEDLALIDQLENEIGDLPIGENTADIEAMKIIRAAAAKLQKS